MANDRNPKKPTSPKKGLDADDILDRVDALPILDPGSPDEIVGYDENGLPTEPKAANRPDFAARGKRLFGERAFDEFLDYRHREWEEKLCAGKGSTQTNA